MAIPFSSKSFFAAIAMAGLSCLGGAFSSSAATANVLVGSGGFVFTPATTNIAAGDQVIWTWAGSFHSTTSDTNGLWDSGIANLPHSFTNQFLSAGTFPYHCINHVAFGMTGSIIVAGANVPPSVAITNPVSGTVFIAPANVTVQASASDSDGTVTNVQFLIGATILSNQTTAPFSAGTNNLAAGSYTLSAIASDNLGTKTTNSVNIIVDTPPSVTITNPAADVVLSAPANVTVQASAADTDGSVTNVQFLIGTTVLTNQTTAPFSAVTNNLPAGSYTFSAIASDDNGVKATNAVTVSVVTPLPLVISAPQFSSASFQFSYAANVGLSYIVQRSTNLVSPNWIPIFTNTAAGSPVVFVDNLATNNPAFYRIGLLPNP